MFGMLEFVVTKACVEEVRVYSALRITANAMWEGTSRSVVLECAAVDLPACFDAMASSTLLYTRQRD